MTGSTGAGLWASGRVRPWFDRYPAMHTRSVLLAASLLLSTVAQAQTPASPTMQAAPHNIADFIRDDRFVDVKISPKGTYVAATVPLTDDDKTVMVILKPGQKEPYGHVTLKEDRKSVV